MVHKQKIIINEIGKKIAIFARNSQKQESAAFYLKKFF